MTIKKHADIYRRVNIFIKLVSCHLLCELFENIGSNPRKMAGSGWFCYDDCQLYVSSGIVIKGLLFTFLNT